MKAVAIIALALTGCMGKPSVNLEIPHCERYIPPSLAKPVESADFPTPRNHPDGHADAQPWREFGLAQSGQLDKANDHGAARDHIWRTCLDEHRGQAVKASRGWLARLFS